VKSGTEKKKRVERKKKCGDRGEKRRGTTSREKRLRRTEEREKRHRAAKESPSNIRRRDTNRRGTKTEELLLAKEKKTRKAPLA